MGTVALVLKLIRQADDRVLLIAQGLRRFSLRKIVAPIRFCARNRFARFN
jgi:hypothetical protein